MHCSSELLECVQPILVLVLALCCRGLAVHCSAKLLECVQLFLVLVLAFYCIGSPVHCSLVFLISAQVAWYAAEFSAERIVHGVELWT